MQNNFDRRNIACLTGHRPKSLPWGYNENCFSCKLFKRECERIFVDAIEYGVHTFLTGMAEGFDMIATEILLKLKRKYKQLKVIAIIPCLNQEGKWKFEQRMRYRQILKQCDGTYMIGIEYTETCMNKKNLFLVQHSEFCIACWNGKPSGTGNTVKYAKENDCKVRMIDINRYYKLHKSNIVKTLFDNE